MGGTLGLRKYYRAARITGLLLLALALGCSAAGCPPESTGEFSLAISSGAGGSITLPGEGSFTYPAGTVVQLVATPDDGYEFLLWTGDITYMAGPNLASTTITMNGNYAVTATFTEGTGNSGGGGPIRP
ncbi:MAG: InlB B-repeat-containing protein [Dehalococcoidia bacterium]